MEDFEARNTGWYAIFLIVGFTAGMILGHFAGRDQLAYAVCDQMKHYGSASIKWDGNRHVLWCQDYVEMKPLEPVQK